MSEAIPMILTCPSCNERHVDAGEFATKPHHTHACQSCGVVWRPALVATVGVQFLPGFKDNPAPGTWIKHDGGPQPVPDHVQVSIWFRGDSREEAEKRNIVSASQRWYWGHDGRPTDIIAYRCISKVEETK